MKTTIKNYNGNNEISLDDIASECDLESVETAFANITSEGFDFALQSRISLSSLPSDAFTNARLANFTDTFRGCGSSGAETDDLI